MSVERPGVLIANAINIPVLGYLPAILRRAGGRVDLIGPRNLSIRRSRHVERHIEVRTDQMVASFRAHLQREGGRYARVIVADEVLLWDLASHPVEPGQAGWPAILPDPGRTARLMSKPGFMAAAVAAGLPVPAHTQARSAPEARAFADRHGFPVVLKDDRSVNGSGVRVAADLPELERLCAAIPPGASVMLQAFVRGRLGDTAFLCEAGHPRFAVSTYNSHPWPHELAASTAKRHMFHRDLPGLVEAVGALSGFTGLCGVDWIHDTERDRIVLLEFNPRPTPGIYTAFWTAMRTDAIASFRDWLRGKPDAAFIHGEAFPVPVELPMYPNALLRAIHERAPGACIKALRRAPWDDPLLLASQMRRVAVACLPERCATALRRWRNGPP